MVFWDDIMLNLNDSDGGVYNTQNYWVSGLCPSSRILNTRKQSFGNWICFRPQTSALLGPLETASLNHWCSDPLMP
jgi:hypothetical protein